MDYVTRADFKAGMDGVQAQIRRLAAEQVKMRETMATKTDIEVLNVKFQAMYQIALESAERARASFNKLLAHGDILQDHEARLRGLERKHP